MSQLNLVNLDRLISHLEGLPKKEFNMGVTIEETGCGTVACIKGHAQIINGFYKSFIPGAVYDQELLAENWLGVHGRSYRELFTPYNWNAEYKTNAGQYPLSRAIRTLKHMRSEFLRTGQVVVDWDAPEPVAREPWTAPKAVELTASLPVEITRLLTTFDRVEVQ